jgi:hypothetical protein
LRTNGTCSNSSHVAKWKLVTLEPSYNSKAVQEPEDEDADWSTDPDDNFLAAELHVGEHFAVLADPEDLGADGAEFFVLVCTRTMHLVEEDTFIDDWNGVTERGDEVVEGLYYKQQGPRQNSYILLQDRGVARLYSHLVCATKFTMSLAPHKQKGGVSVCKLSDAAMLHIRDVVRSKQQPDDLDLEDKSQGAANNSRGDSDSTTNVGRDSSDFDD